MHNKENEVKSMIFDLVYEMALRDAIMRKAYPWPSKETDPEKEKEREEKIKQIRASMFQNKDAKKLLRDYIDALLNGKPKDFYQTADKVKQAFVDHGAPEFTFGNTQKVLNMMVKYVYIAAYQEEIHADLHEKFRKCHCPMDSIMIEKVIESIESKIHEEEVCNLLKGHERNWRGFLRNPWSKMDNDYEQYILFQNLVKYLSTKEGLTPIEYDFKVWNEEIAQEQYKSN